jgi:hypothetical protein
MSKTSIIILFLMFPPTISMAQENIMAGLCQTQEGYCGFLGFMRCGKYFKGEPACTDVPSILYDAEGNKVAECGGMPLPNDAQRPNNDLCDIPCDSSKVFHCPQVSRGDYKNSGQ